MAVREPKTRTNTTIEVVGRDAKKKGTIQLSSGNIIYSRPHGEETFRLTYQQLIDLFEKELEYRRIDEAKSMPKGRRDRKDFSLEAWDGDEVEGFESLISATCPLEWMQAKRMNQGRYDIDPGIAKGRQPKRRFWQASISVQAVLTILDHYINRGNPPSN